MVANENRALIAADVMSREVISLPRNMPLRDVVHLLAERDQDNGSETLTDMKIADLFRKRSD